MSEKKDLPVNPSISIQSSPVRPDNGPLLETARTQEITAKKLDAATTPPKTPSLIKDPETLQSISFPEAATMLAEVFSLNGWKEKTIRYHNLIGLPNKLKEKGFLKDVNAYQDLIDQVRFTPKGLKELIVRLKNGESWEPTFNPGFLTYAELWEALFLENDGNIVPEDINEGDLMVKVDPDKVCLTSKYVMLPGRIDWDEIMAEVANMREVSPKDIAGLETLDPYVDRNPDDPSAYSHRYLPERAVKETTLAVYRAAHAKAPQLQPGSPKIVFSPSESKQQTTSNAMRSPIEYAIDAKNGTCYIDPGSDLIRLREYLLYANTYMRKVLYPLFVFETGKVFQLYLNSHHSSLTLEEVFPSIVISDAAPTRVLS